MSTIVDLCDSDDTDEDEQREPPSRSTLRQLTAGALVDDELDRLLHATGGDVEQAANAYLDGRWRELLGQEAAAAASSSAPAKRPNTATSVEQEPSAATTAVASRKRPRLTAAACGWYVFRGGQLHPYPPTDQIQLECAWLRDEAAVSVCSEGNRFEISFSSAADADDERRPRRFHVSGRT